MAKAEPRVELTSRSRVRHRVSNQLGYASTFNNNHNDPAYWVDWDDGYSGNWFALADVEVLDGKG